MKVKIKYTAIAAPKYEDLADIINDFNHPCIVTQPIRDSHCWRMIISYIEPVNPDEELTKLAFL